MFVYASTYTHTHARAYAQAHAYTYIKHYFAGIYIWSKHTHNKAHEKRLSVRLQFLIKDFSKIIWLVGIKVLTLQADTGNDEETTETNAANSIHAHGYNRNEMRALLVI